MWKKDDVKSPAASEGAATVSSATVGTQNSSSSNTSSSSNAAACIGRGIRIKGEVTGTEDLFVDGQVEGRLNLTTNSCLTVGPNGDVKADLTAREIIVRGKVEGKVTARDKLLIGSTGQINGEVQTDRLAIEDGALLRGKVEAGKQLNKPVEAKASAATATASATTKSSQSTAVDSGTAAD
jgi:cytoskeletal protein CcmA (bactofilin family)